MRKKQEKIKTYRFIIQITVLITAIVAAFNHYLSSINKGIPWVLESIFHYICPICGVTTIYQFLTSPTLFVDKLQTSLAIILGLALITVLIFGPVICGFICPFGTIQDIIAKIGKKLFRIQYNKFVPEDVDKNLKYLRYITLVLTVIITAQGGVLFLEKINPYHGVLGLFNGKLYLTGFIVLTLVMCLSLFIQRPWCRYLCPYGALLGLSNKIKIFRITRNTTSCISCKRCNKECPMGIELTVQEDIRDLNCISCLDCTSENVCPVSDILIFNSKEIKNEGELVELEQAIERVDDSYEQWWQ